MIAKVQVIVIETSCGVDVLEGMVEEVVELAIFRREADEADEDRGDRKQHQRDRHPRPGLVRVDVAGIEPFLAEEDQEDQPEHVERGQERGRQQRRSRPSLPIAESLIQAPTMISSFDQKPASGTNPALAGRADQERPEGERHVLAQPAHVLDVLLFVHAVDDRAGAEEEEALEEGVRHQVEDRGDPGPGPDRGGHVAKLREGGVGDDALDVVLGEGDRRGHEGGEGADDGHDQHRGFGADEDRVAAGAHVDAGGDHRRRVDQGGDRGRAFHRVRQPDVQRELGALAAGADEEQDADQGHRAAGNAEFLVVVGRFEQPVLAPEVDGVEGPEREHDAEAETRGRRRG